MKKIIYTRPDGGLTVLHPVEGARLAKAVHFEDGTFMAADPQPVDRFVRQWPVPGAVAVWAETEDEFVARIAAKDVPAGAANAQIVDESAIPADRTFRNAWKAGSGVVEHDMDKAREIQKNTLRAMRAPLLAALDVEFMRALEVNDMAQASAVAAQKQALRDVTADPAIAAATTPEALLAVVPDALT